MMKSEWWCDPDTWDQLRIDTIAWTFGQGDGLSRADAEDFFSQYDLQIQSRVERGRIGTAAVVEDPVGYFFRWRSKRYLTWLLRGRRRWRQLDERPEAIPIDDAVPVDEQVANTVDAERALSRVTQDERIMLNARAQGHSWASVVRSLNTNSDVPISEATARKRYSRLIEGLRS